MRFLLALPHLLILLWLIWLAFVPHHAAHLLRRHDATEQLRKTNELMSFKEIRSVGCVGGFILLTFITLYCSYLTLSAHGVI